MINCNLYSVLDEKAQVFSQMFFRRRHEEAIRYFGDACRDEKTSLHAHPADYALYFHGTMDVESGLVEPIVPVQFLARGSEFVTSFDNGRVTSEVKS